MHAHPCARCERRRCVDDLGADASDPFSNFWETNRDKEALVDKRTVGKLLLAYVAHGRSAEALDELVRARRSSGVR